MAFTISHHFDNAIDVGYDNKALFTYVYVPDMPANESPKPYFHPIYTLGGNEISCYRPYDHLWHKGLQMTVAHLSEQNFWGGSSFVKDRGYVQLPNNGRMQHVGWEKVELQSDRVVLAETLDWLTQAGERWVREERTVEVSECSDAEGYYCLDFNTELTNVRATDLVFGSPTTAGRPKAGYGGLFWRGPRSFTQSGKIWTATGLSTDDVPESDIMGSSAAWLAYTGRHDGSGNRSTLLFLDHPSNLRFPTKWFVRRDPFACVSFAFSFDEEYALAPQQVLPLQYRIIIYDGECSQERIEDHVRHWHQQ